jgi:hypothetical protein
MSPSANAPGRPAFMLGVIAALLTLPAPPLRKRRPRHWRHGTAKDMLALAHFSERNWADLVFATHAA